MIDANHPLCVLPLCRPAGHDRGRVHGERLIGLLPESEYLSEISKPIHLFKE